MNSNLLPLSSLPTLLQPGALLTLESVTGLCIEIVSGRLWVTEEGDRDDHFLSAGMRHVVQGRGRLVMEVDSRVPVRLLYAQTGQTEGRRAARPDATLASNVARSTSVSSLQVSAASDPVGA